MPTTSNFGWTTPADTDYVKDGALAIRTLANGIDTSLVDLKGGTTGQILSKNSNTDLDYTWINNDQGDITAVNAGTGISVTGGTGPTPTVAIDSTVATLTGTQTLTNKTLTAPVVSTISNTGTLTLPTSTDTLVGRATTDTLTNKTISASSNTLTGVINNTLTTTTGDIIYASSANTPARLGIGSSGQVLTVSGGIPSWATAASGGGYTLLETLTLSGSSTTSSSISNSYKHLFIEVKDVYFSSTDTLGLKLNGTSSGYYFHQLRIDGTTLSADNPSNFSQVQCVDLGNNSADSQRGYGTIFIPRYTDTASVVEFQCIFKGYISGTMRSMITWGIFDNSSAISTIALNCGTRTFSGGTAYIYGVS